MSESDTTPFKRVYTGYLKSLLRWPDLDAFWARLREQAGDEWYIYAVGEAPPSAPASRAQLLAFIDEIDKLLHADHDEDYCGIVYTDNPEQPSLVKIFDPHNLGSSCGPGFGVPILPGWVLSTQPPDDLQAAVGQTGSRQRWWQRLFN